MTNHTIITIGRQFGSGGHEIGNCLAERLNIPLYDKNLVNMAAEKLKISEAEAASVDETALSKFLASYVVAPTDYMVYVKTEDFARPLSDQMYKVQADIIRKLADQGPCVIVGRCADYILRDHDKLINAFICASKEDRVKRIVQLYDMTEKAAAGKIKRIDRERRYYYETHTGMDWGSIDSHQLLLNVSMLGKDKVVDILAGMYEMNAR